ncbi:MAG: vWA domain-containing protein [Myxococcota bacterium]
MDRLTTAGLALALVTLSFAPQAQADDKSAHNCLAILVDASGSMEGTKMVQAKKTLTEVLSKLPQDTWVAVLAFSNEHVATVYPLNQVDTTKLNTAINAIRPSGGTPLGKAIKAGADILMTERAKQHGYGNYQLVIVTDGEASGQGEPSRMQTYAPMVGQRRIRMDVIGVEMPGGQRHWLANTAHSYQAAEDAVALAAALKQAISVESTGGGDTGVSDFELLAGLSDEVAKGFLQAATAPPPNHPLGTTPQPPASTKNTPKSPTPKKAAPPATPPTSPSGGGGAPSAGGSQGCQLTPGQPGSNGFAVVALVLLWLATTGAARRRYS